VWRYITLLTIGYMISRGLAKAGMPRALLLLLLLVALAGCGGAERVDQFADDAQRELGEQRERLRAEVRRLRQRVDELIGRLEQAVPRAQRTSPDVDEYAHNLQHELGLFSLARANSSKPFELQADCLAGAWGSSVFAEGKLQPRDIEEAVGTALAVGDFDVSNANHHSTPAERRGAWLTGFRSADPSSCARFVPSA
jgi:hypothetical protein